MKKAILLILAAALTLGAFQNSLAAGRTSTQLATTTNLINNITQPDGGIPIGTVIAWPYAALPSDGNWLECNGQTVNASFTDFRSKFGATVPDYRGLFLRGQGNGSAGLNVLQPETITQAFTEHRHAAIISKNGIGYNGHGCCGAVAYDDNDISPYNQGGAGVKYSGPAMFTFKGTPVVSNKAVKYIIKVR